MKAKDITIAICTYRRDRLLEKCLIKLLDQSVEGFQTLVVDNACSEACMKVAKKYQVSYVSESQVGLSHARTRAILETKTPVLFYLDDDALPDNELVKETLKSFRNKNVGVVGGMYSHYFEGRPPKWVESIYAHPYRATNKNGLVQLEAGEYLSGGIMAFRRKILIESGGFNQNLGMAAEKFGYGEEDEIQDRIRGLGYGIFFNSEMKMDHLVAPRKYLLSNQIKMAYSHGIAWKSVSIGHEITALGLLKQLNHIVLNRVPRCLAKVLVRKNYYWQNAVIEIFGGVSNIFGRYRGQNYSK